MKLVQLFPMFIMSLFALSLVFHFQSERDVERSQDQRAQDVWSELKTKRDEVLGKPQIVLENKKQIQKHVLINDPAIDAQWGLQIQEAEKAWEITQGSRDVVVAIVDTGVDINHPDLKKNLWVNQGEVGLDSQGRDKKTNKIDDDGNGYVDDVHGWNFVDNNSYVQDFHGHGTHISGIVGAEGGNKIGISGVSPQVSLMVLKYYDVKNPQNNLVNSVKAIEYAVKMKAHIINYSGGGSEPSLLEKKVLSEAEEKDILIVAAAGNEYSNSDEKPYYPADYNLGNIISVTAINQGNQEKGRGGQILKSSNYGIKTVDIAAPGHRIYSTLPSGKYGYMTGTSQATAFVTGVASLLMAYNPYFQKASHIKKYLTQTGDKEASLIGKTLYQTRINSFRALTMMGKEQTVAGIVPSNLKEDIKSQNSLNLNAIKLLSP